MNKISSKILFLLLFIISFVYSSTIKANNEANNIYKVIDNDSIIKDTVHLYFFGSVPFALNNKNGEVVGVNPDIIHEVLRRNGLAYSDLIGDFDSFKKEIEAGRIDLLVTANFMKQWHVNSPEVFINSQYTIPHYYGFFTRRFSNINKVEDLANTKVVFLRTFNKQNIPYDLCHIKKENTIECLSFIEALKMLDEHKVDAIVSSVPSLMYYMNLYNVGIGYEFFEMGEMTRLHYGISQGQNLISVKQFDSTLLEMLNEGFIDEVWNKWSGQPQSRILIGIHIDLFILCILSFILVIILMYFLKRINKSFKTRKLYNDTLKNVLNSFPHGVLIEIVSNKNITYFKNNAYKISNLADCEKVKNENFLFNKHNSFYYDKKDYTFYHSKKEYKISLYTNITELILTTEEFKNSELIKTDFITNIGEEIMIPVNNIRIIGKSITHQMPIAKYKELAIKLEENSSQILNMFLNVIQLSKMCVGSQKNNLLRVDINELVKTSFSWANKYLVYMGKKNDNKIRIIYDQIYDNLFLTTDVERVKLCLNNVLLNACKYTNEGEIHVGVYCTKGYFYAYVKDTGVGISENRLKRILNRNLYESVDDITTMGFGIAMVKLIMHKIPKSEFDGISKEGIGSIFWIKMKLVPDIIELNDDKQVFILLQNTFKIILTHKI
ncbi:MAG: transporter substrate-binding domain-containing protein [Bacteroidales bacterium]